jgi:hypothetical protein
VYRRFAFWAAVAGVSVLANLGLEVLAHRTGNPGLLRFAALTHLGAGGAGNGG